MADFRLEPGDAEAAVFTWKHAVHTVTMARMDKYMVGLLLIKKDMLPCRQDVETKRIK